MSNEVPNRRETRERALEFLRLQPRGDNDINNVEVILLHKHHVSIPVEAYSSKRDMINGDTTLLEIIDGTVVVGCVEARFRGYDEHWDFTDVG